MLKIVVETDRRDGDAVLRLEGQIIGPSVYELYRASDRLIGGGALALDLSHVSFVERRGVELLRVLDRHGVQLLHCTPFIAEQLKA